MRILVEFFLAKKVMGQWKCQEREWAKLRTTSANWYDEGKSLLLEKHKVWMRFLTHMASVIMIMAGNGLE